MYKLNLRYIHNSIILLAITTLISIASKRSLGQEADTTRSANQYIERHKQELALKLAITNNIESFSVHSGDLNYTLQPNTDLKMKLFFSYRSILFSVGYAPGFLPGNNDNRDKGKSDIFEFATNVNMEHWFQRLSYSKIKGFYSENPNYVPGLNDQYFTFPELQYKGFYGYTAYKVNPNYSILSLENQTERQLKSAGSLLPILVYRYYTIDNKIELTENNSSQISNNFEFNLSLGYFYTFVINQRWYAAAGVATGGGMIFTKLLTRFYDERYTNHLKAPIFRTEAAASLGYNSKRFFAGLQMAGYREHYNQDKASNAITHEGVNFQVFAGYRFGAPTFLSRSLGRFAP
ncbi:DUF4421 family protein [Maribellus sediminis]|uniref:DUF4421 family protein n=1 Tax=Maribellus sediminis TaxID=2696285 RepID=UPI00143009D4|nr:DUF4421 family protein [Maribellus sediminis]